MPRKKGYSILFEPVRSKKAWELYIKKDQKTGKATMEHIALLLSANRSMGDLSHDSTPRVVNRKVKRLLHSREGPPSPADTVLSECFVDPKRIKNIFRI